MDDRTTGDLCATDAWFRDTLYQTLLWGGASLGLLVAWLVTTADVFAFSTCGGGRGVFSSKPCSGASILSGTAVLLIPFWLYSLNRLWKKVPPHPTRIRRWELNLYAAAIATAAAIIIVSAVLD